MSRYPGAHVPEGDSVPPPIAAVPTSTALFAGWTPRGPADRAVRIGSADDFARELGAGDPRALLAYAVEHFFENGGRDAYVIRLASRDGDDAMRAADPTFHDAVTTAFSPGGIADGIDLFNLVCVPGLTDAPTLAFLQRRCRERRAFLVVDGDEAATTDALVDTLSAFDGGDALWSAIYVPWVVAPDRLRAGAPRAFPPSGFVAGVMARTDAERGVWKAPAGRDAELRGATGLVTVLTDRDQERLAPVGVNCLRSFSGGGPVVWGARTLHGLAREASEWTFVPVRRLALFLEESLQRGTRWAVFEPNGEPLWSSLRLQVGDFLRTLFRAGAFQGASEREAFLVKCDRETTSAEDIARGIVTIVVGFAPLRPAEFVVLTIRQAASAPP